MALYVGETARTARERFNGASGHLEDYKRNSDKSHMYKHWKESHNGEKRPEFGVKILRSFTSCMMRQLWECVRIRRRSQEEGVRILNSRGEFSRCSLPRLVIEDSIKIDRKEESFEKEKQRREMIGEESESTIAESNNQREPTVLKGKNRVLKTKTKGQVQKLADIKTYFKSDGDRGLT